MNVRKALLLVLGMLLCLAVAVGPAMADPKHHGDGDRHKDFDGLRLVDFDDFDFDDFDDFDHDNNGDDGSDQFAHSGDLAQSLQVINTGDNANQCVGGVLNGNTGNAQSQFNGAAGDDLDADGVGSQINTLANGTTTCDQTVDQDATVYTPYYYYY